MPDRITLYAAKICPSAQRVELALLQAGAPYARFEVDLANKPAWFATQVNPASKVPAIAYGGPAVPPSSPSPASFKLAESLVIVEFIADLYPAARILPSDPVLRAKARLFVDAVAHVWVPAYQAWWHDGGPYAPFLEAVGAVQALLPADGTFAAGDAFGAADIAIVPFIGRMEVIVKYDIGRYPVGQSKVVAAALAEPRFARWRRYVRDVKANPHFAKTFDEEYLARVFPLWVPRDA